MKKKKTRKKLSYENKKRLYGYGFLSLWMAGTLVFFIIPLIVSFIYSFQDVNPQTGGMKGVWVGFKNYSEAFGKDPYYRTYLVDSLLEMLRTTPIILIFSLFCAVLLNQKFKGRALVRAIFFYRLL